MSIRFNNTRFVAVAVAVASLLWTANAAAVHTPQYRVPYFGFEVSTFSPDSVRQSDQVGTGYQAFLGFPVSWLSEDDREALEIRLLDHQMKRELDTENNYQTGLFADYVYDLGTSVEGEGGFFSGTKLFVLAGLGMVQEDNYGQQANVLAANGGVGLLIPLGFKGWGIRLEGRMQYENGGDACNPVPGVPAPCGGQKPSNLIDTFFSAGIQIPLTIFFDRPVVVPPAEDCPVSAEGGTSGDCRIDSDRDGVIDADDQCPGTSSGEQVDEKGCTRIRSLP